MRFICVPFPSLPPSLPRPPLPLSLSLFLCRSVSVFLLFVYHVCLSVCLAGGRSVCLSLWSPSVSQYPPPSPTPPAGQNLDKRATRLRVREQPLAGLVIYVDAFLDDRSPMRDEYGRLLRTLGADVRVRLPKSVDTLTHLVWQGGDEGASFVPVGGRVFPACSV